MKHKIQKIRLETNFMHFPIKGAFIIYGREGGGWGGKSIGKKKSAPPPSRIHRKKIDPPPLPPHCRKIFAPLPPPPPPCFKNMPLCFCCAPTTVIVIIHLNVSFTKKKFAEIMSYKNRIPHPSKYAIKNKIPPTLVINNECSLIIC